MLQPLPLSSSSSSSFSSHRIRSIVVMKLIVKRLGYGQTGMLITIEDDKTVGELKDAIGTKLWLPGSTLKLIFAGRILADNDAKIKSYGVMNGSLLTVIFTPNVDMRSNLARTISALVGRSVPHHLIPTVVVHFKFILVKIIERDLSLDDLEEYAKMRNSPYRKYPLLKSQQKAINNKPSSSSPKHKSLKPSF